MGVLGAVWSGPELGEMKVEKKDRILFPANSLWHGSETSPRHAFAAARADCLPLAVWQH